MRTPIFNGPMVHRLSCCEVKTRRTKSVRKVNNYTLSEKIGAGASGKVYLGTDDSTDKQFAVKLVRFGDRAKGLGGIGQLEREVRLLRSLDHPNIMKLREVLHVPSLQEMYVVLEYAEKGSLDGFIQRGQKLTEKDVFSILKQVALATKYIHGRGFVHQDIKPSNILLDGKGMALLADFGIGHSFQSAQMIVGTPAYQAPEAILGGSDDSDEEVDHAPEQEDVWALGVTLYQTLFMKLPFEGNNLYEIVNTIKSAPLYIPEGTDAAIVSLLKGTLEIDPAKRFTIDDVLEHELVSSAPDTAVDLPSSPAPKRIRGSVVELSADVCTNGNMFASLTIPHRRMSHMCGALHELPRMSGL